MEDAVYATSQDNRRQLTCVLRDLGDGTGPQYVPLSEVPHLADDEKAFAGLFNCRTENHGPSGSHRRTVCSPLGRLVDAERLTCVLRDLGDGTGPQYVPVGEVPQLGGEEKTFTGFFHKASENHGPSGSHRRTVCTPMGKLDEAAAA